MNYKRFQLNLIHLNSVDSTNNFAANLIKTSKVVNGTLIVTKRQYSGKGQRGNSWLSENDKNLTCSVITLPKIKTKNIFYLNMVASLAIRKTLEDLRIDALIKWPNDILVNRKKIAGILIENQISGGLVASSIVGVGLNVNQSNFDETINATSILNELNQILEIEDVMLQFYAYLDFYLNHLMDSNYQLLEKAYYRYLFGLNEWMNFMISTKKVKAKILGITEAGKLSLELSNGKIASFEMQEVKLLLKNE